LTKKRRKNRTRNIKKKKKADQGASIEGKKKKRSDLLKQAEETLMVHGLVLNSSKNDKIFVEAGHFLTNQMRTKLSVAHGILNNKDVINRNAAPIPTRIDYNEIDQDLLSKLKHLGVPVSEDIPFKFDFEALARFIENKTNCGSFLNSFCELIITEAKINFFRGLFTEFGFEEYATNEPDHKKFREIIREHHRAHHNGHEPIISNNNIDLRAMRGLWIANHCLVLIRSQWDKLLKQFIGENYFQIKANKSFDKCCKRIEECSDKDLNLSQEKCRTAFINLAGNTSALKDWRDNELHFIAPTIFGVFENHKTEMGINDVWALVTTEHNRVREAVMAAIGIVMLGTETTQTTICGKWEYPTKMKKVNLDDPADANDNAALLDSIDKLRQDQNNLDLKAEIHSVIERLYGASGTAEIQIRQSSQ